jgi:hypothetical protein
MSRPAGSPRTAAAAAGRQADAARRRQRVIGALNQATDNGGGISVAGIARAAGVDRSFLYRHRDLLEQLHAAEAHPRAAAAAGPAVSRASLQADLANAGHRAARLAARVQQLEKRLSEALGEQAWQACGLGAPDDLDALHQRIVGLEQTIADLRLQLDERTDELAAARAANRELMLHANASS